MTKQKLFFILLNFLFSFAIFALEITKIDTKEVSGTLRRKIFITHLEHDDKNSELSRNVQLLKHLMDISITKSEILLPDTDTTADLSTAKFNNISPDISAHIVIYGNAHSYFDKTTFDINVWDTILHKKIYTEKFTITDDILDNLTVIVEKITRNIESYCSDNQPELLKNTLILKGNGTYFGKERAAFLLNQKNALVNEYFMKNGNKYHIPVIFGRNTLIVINNQGKDFTLSDGTKVFPSENSTIVLSADFEDNSSTAVLELLFSDDPTTDKIPITFYKSDETIIKYINPEKYKTPFKSSCFLDIKNTGTTTGYTGVELKFGVGLPMKSAFKNSLYTKTGIEYNISDKRVQNGDFSSLRLRMGLGYNYHQYIFSMVSLIFGFEIGFEVSFFNTVYEGNRKLLLEDTTYGFPAFYMSLPFNLEIPSTSKISFVVGLDPTFRITQRTIIYKDSIWGGDLYKNAYNGYEPVLKTGFSDDSNTPGYIVDPFSYDIPFSAGVRIKF